jgi:integrase
VKRARQIREASLAELEAITLAMPPRYRLMVLLAAWCALRFGELTELRRSEHRREERRRAGPAAASVPRRRRPRREARPSPRPGSAPSTSRRT